MDSVALDLFLPEVFTEAQGAPTPVVLNAVRNACFDFCRKSLWLNYVESPVQYTAGVQTYTLTPPQDMQVLGVMDINLDGVRTIYPWPRDDVAALRPAWQSDKGLVEGFVQLANNTVSLVKVPDTNGQFTPTVAYAPTRDAATIDRRIYDLHLEAIKYGALWKLKSATDQPWSDKAGAQMYEKLFLVAVNNATVERLRTNTRASVRVMPTPFI